MSKLYDKKRDLIKLEPHYTKHVAAMTDENLHSKGEIAAELASRDQHIEVLDKSVESLTMDLGLSEITKGMRKETIAVLEQVLVKRNERIRQLEEWQRAAVFYLEDIYVDHRNKHSGGYNECEIPGKECCWCSEVGKLVERAKDV